MIDLERNTPQGARIRVIGVGGGGGNAVNNMIARGIPGVEFLTANTDKQALAHSKAQGILQIGESTTNGLGSGSDPAKGRDSALESEKDIKQAIAGSDMIFVTAGMGGGTGTGGAPEVARIAKESGALVVGIVTKPFRWEGRKRIAVADNGIKELRKNVDGLIVIPNQKLLEIVDTDIDFEKAFEKVDEVLYNATRGIADIISKHGKVNVDFADVRAIMSDMGDALMGIGIAKGEHRSIEAIQNALNSPLLDGLSIRGSKGLLVNIAGKSVGIREIESIGSYLEKEGIEEANCIFGLRNSDEFDEEIMVTVIATGFHKQEEINSAERTQEMNNSMNKNLFGDVEINNRNLQTQKAFSPAINQVNNNFNQQTKQIYSNKPKGFTQLKKFDQPAIDRMHNPDKLQPVYSETGSNSLKTFHELAEERSIRNIMDQPTFIRRIMD